MGITDCRNVGIGCGGGIVRWPSEWAYTNIAILEFFPIVLSLFLWGHEMKNRCILFFTDNEVLVHVINKQSCRDKILMSCQLVLICLRNNIVFKAKHVPGSRNALVDALSRLQVQTFQRRWHHLLWTTRRQTFLSICSPRTGRYSFTPDKFKSPTFLFVYVRAVLEVIL